MGGCLGPPHPSTSDAQVGQPRDWCWGVRDPWLLGDVGGFLLLMGPFVIKAKLNECLGSSLGKPLCLPPQPQLVSVGSSSALQP